MSKHTPGPWILKGSKPKYRGDKRIDREIRGDNGRRVVVRLGEGDMEDPDARLITAAPDLLAALHELAEIGEGGVIERRETGKPTWIALEAVATIARAAIAKAETEQQ